MPENETAKKLKEPCPVRCINGVARFVAGPEAFKPLIGLPMREIEATAFAVTDPETGTEIRGSLGLCFDCDDRVTLAAAASRKGARAFFISVDRIYAAAVFVPKRRAVYVVTNYDNRLAQQYQRLRTAELIAQEAQAIVCAGIGGDHHFGVTRA